MARLSAVLTSRAVHAALWQADQLGASAGLATAVCASGFAALDAALPGGGWPLGAMVEVLQAQPGLHEWQLLLPALAALSQRKPVLLVGAASAAFQPFAPGLTARGLDGQRLLWVDSPDAAARLWAAEQGLRCKALAAVLVWLPLHQRVAMPALRRLHLAAHAHGQALFVFRPAAVAQESSPAPLRVLLGEAPGSDQACDAAMCLRILKRRGPPLTQALALPAQPDAIAALLAASHARRAQGRARPVPAPMPPGNILLLPRRDHALDRPAVPCLTRQACRWPGWPCAGRRACACWTRPCCSKPRLASGSGAGAPSCCGWCCGKQQTCARPPGRRARPPCSHWPGMRLAAQEGTGEALNEEGQQGACALAPARLPLRSLSAARPHLDMLQRAGLRTWGDLRALPRAGLARRFGAGLLEALDQAWGERPDSHRWLQLPEQFVQQVELLSLATSAPALVFGSQRLLNLLRAWLQARQRGVLALDLVWRYDLRRMDGVELPPQEQLHLRTAEPTQDMQHLGRLLAENLARVQLAAPVNALLLRATDTAPLIPAHASLLPGEGDDKAGQGDSLHQLVERLGARLGPAHVLQAVAQADHRPEWRQRWQPAEQGLQALQAAPCAQPHPGGALLPTTLLRQPLALPMRGNRPHYQGPLRLLVGPQRLETGWWLDAQDQTGLAVRDYFIAHSAEAGLLWIYRERLGVAKLAHWFLQGIYA